MRSFSLVVALLATLAYPAFAEINFPAANPSGSNVMVLSDAIAEADSAASQILGDIAVVLDKESGVRLLSVAGYGGPTNARDLLQLRGADFAVLNSDVLAYLDLAKALPEARKKIRMVAPLFHQSVLVFGRQGIKSIGDLRGHKIGIPASRPSRGLTARTVFGLLNIEAEFIELDDAGLAKRAEDLDAIVLYENDAPSLPALGITPASHHILPLAASGPLAAVYLPGKPIKIALAEFNTGDALKTIQVTTLLAGFDWGSKQTRYPDVSRFVGNFYALIPQIRARNPNSPFSRTDVREAIPGWKRFGPAEALAAAAPQVPAGDGGAPLSARADALRLIVVPRPPLTNGQAGDGGVALKIMTGALNAAGLPYSVKWVDSERALLDGLLVNKTADIGLFWQTPRCDAPSHQTAREAEFCDRTVLSEPLMLAVIGIFTRLDTPLDPKNPEAAQVRTLCVPEGLAVTEEALAGIRGLKPASVKTVRQNTLIDCLAAVDRREADAMIAIEPEARFTIERLRLSGTFQISQRLPTAMGLHAVASSENPVQVQLIRSVNEALAQFRTNGGYSAVMTSHLTDLTGAPALPPK